MASFQVRLSDVSNVSLLDRRGYLTLLLQLHNEDNLVLRKAENIRDWYNVILGLVQDTRAKMMPSAEQFWKTKGSEVWSEWAGPRREREVQDRPSSVASVDRRHRHRHRHHRRRAKSHSKTTPVQSHMKTCIKTLFSILDAQYAKIPLIEPFSQGFCVFTCWVF